MHYRERTFFKRRGRRGQAGRTDHHHLTWRHHPSWRTFFGKGERRRMIQASLTDKCPLTWRHRITWWRHHVARLWGTIVNFVQVLVDVLVWMMVMFLELAVRICGVVNVLSELVLRSVILLAWFQNIINWLFCPWHNVYGRPAAGAASPIWCPLAKISNCFGKHLFYNPFWMNYEN